MGARKEPAEPHDSHVQDLYSLEAAWGRLQEHAFLAGLAEHEWLALRAQDLHAAAEGFWTRRDAWTEEEALALLAGFNRLKLMQFERDDPLCRAEWFKEVPGFDVDKAVKHERRLCQETVDPYLLRLLAKIGRTAYEETYRGKAHAPAAWLDLFACIGLRPSFLDGELPTKVPTRAWRAPVSRGPATEPADAFRGGGDPLSAVIEETAARCGGAQHRNPIWQELMRMAKQKPVRPPLLEFVDGEGVKFEKANGEAAILTREQLGQRLKRLATKEGAAARREPPQPAAARRTTSRTRN